MNKFFRNLIITAIVAVCGIVLYQTTHNAYASGGRTHAISYATGFGAPASNNTGYYVFVAFTGYGGDPQAGDKRQVNLTTNSLSGSLGTYYITGSENSLGQFQFTGGYTFNLGTTFQSYTGATLRAHVSVYDSASTDTGYFSFQIDFTGGSSGSMTDAQWAALYTGTIFTAVGAGGINSNLNTVTAGNVSNFQNVYFEKPGYGRITLQTGLDLRDNGVQRFLQNLSGYISMNNGFVQFVPTGSGANFNVNAQLTMYFATGSTFVTQYTNPNMIIVRDSTGNVIPSSGLLTSLSGTCISGGICSLIFNTQHFTTFGTKPLLTSVHITSTQGTGAWGGDTVYVSFTGSEAITGVSVTIAGQAATVIGGGNTYTANYTLTTGGAGAIPFTIDFRNNLGNSGDQVTATSDSSYVNYYNSGSVTLTGSFTISGASSTRTTGVTLILQSQSGVTYTISGNIAANLTGIMTSPSVTRNVSLTAEDGVKTIYVQFASGAVQSTLYSNTITLDQTAPNATGAYSTMALTNQDVIVTLTGYSESLTGINATTHTFTGNGSFTFTFSDLAGNTGSVATTVTWIDKTPVTGSVSYSPATLTNQNVVATLSLNKTGVTITNNSGATGYTFTSSGIFIFTFQDAYGNTGSTTATVTWIDKIAPTASVMYTNTGANVLASLTGASETITGTTTHLFTGNGTYTFNFSDLAGNTGTAAASAVIQITSGTISTGTTSIGGATTTGVTFASTGTLNIVSTGSANNTLAISVSGVIITASGGTRDGVLIPPTDLTGGDSNNATTTELGLSSSTNTVLLTIQAGATTDSLTISSGSYFNVSFVVSAGTNGDTLKLYRSTNGSTRTANVPDATCILNSSLVCSFRTDHLSYFTTVKETSSGGGGGGGGGSSSSDTSTGTTTVVKGSGSIVGSPFSIEINNAYLYAYDIGITTMDTIQKANITGSLIRAHMAKMMVNYAIKILGKYPDTAKTCTFTDTADQTSEMKNYITRACQLGLMGVNMTKFDPNGEVTRAQFGTVLSRSLYGTGYDGGTPYYLKHLNALKANNIITNINPDLKEIRGYVMLMLMRAQ